MSKNILKQMQKKNTEYEEVEQGICVMKEGIEKMNVNEEMKYKGRRRETNRETLKIKFNY